MPSKNIIATHKNTKSPKITPRRPRFDDMWNNYPEGLDAEEAYKKAGGAVYEAYIYAQKKGSIEYRNACAIRISMALNGAEHRIPSGTQPEGKMYRLSGTGGKYAYFLKKDDVAKFIKSRWKAPEIVVTGSGEDKKKAILGKRGLIIFDVQGWDNARGHVTLWNGEKCIDTCYFDAASIPGSINAKTIKYEFWELK